MPQSRVATSTKKRSGVAPDYGKQSGYQIVTPPAYSVRMTLATRSGKILETTGLKAGRCSAEGPPVVRTRGQHN
jgi:hypothetical protein